MDEARKGGRVERRKRRQERKHPLHLRLTGSVQVLLNSRSFVTTEREFPPIGFRSFSVDVDPFFFCFSIQSKFISEMNRQHMALFLHRCHLVLLLRQEPGAGLERDAYAPAEWRWTLPEVCDGAWHHYAVNVYDGTKESTDEKSSNSDNLSAPLPKVKLHIDGKEFAQTRKNPNMVNDFPLHRSRIHATKTVVGGCWMGRSTLLPN